MSSEASHLDRVRSIVGSWIFSYVRLDRETGKFYLYDPDLQCRAGYTTHMMVASFLALSPVRGEFGNQLILDLALTGHTMQHSNGGVSQPYNVGFGSEPLLDVVEFGAVAGNVAWLADKTGSEVLYDGLMSGAEYILKQRSSEVLGGVYKNEKSVTLDVINASAYACNTWAHAYAVCGDSRFLDAANDSIDHLIYNFSRSYDGWWVYSQKWEGGVSLGPSTAYQASIVALIGEVIGTFSPAIQEKWVQVRADAMHSVVQALGSGSPKDFEVPSWSRDWENVYEIDWALSNCMDLPGIAGISVQRRAKLVNELESGKKSWVPPSSGMSLISSPITSRFRKLSNLAGSLFRISVTGPESS